MRSWKLWTRPLPAVAYLLGVDVLAAALLVWGTLASPVHSAELPTFTVIVVLGVLAAETSRYVERIRRRLAETPHVNLTSVWTLSAALLTSPGLMLATTVILYGHMWLRIWRRMPAMHAYRVVFSASMVVLSCLAARSVADLAPNGRVVDEISALGMAWIVLVILVYSVVNSGLVAIAIALLQNDRSVTTLLGNWQENSIEYATLCMGALTAVLLAWRPWLVALIFLPLWVLHRSVLIRQLEHAATTDEKTGLLNATSWQTLANNELHRAERHGMQLALLMVDLDHFKWVNDQFGHLVGDQVLRAVADAMREEVRDYDLCGRFGGEEFVLLLPDTDLTRAIEVGNRICGRIRDLNLGPDSASLGGMRLSASIGVATYPDAGKELDEILLAADNAMFAAKDSGRDQVRAVMPGRGPDRRTPSPTE
jgi:diguanylate cyclase (GGDEF)-like protein